jgi:hypothetical protein
MVIYEITAVVQAELVEEYEKYMRDRHIPDLLATGYFSGAYFTRARENHYRVHYQANNQESLDKYLSLDAKRLRADFLTHFPTGVELSREIWEVIEVLPKTR